MSKFKLISFWVFVAGALGFAVFGYLRLKNNHKPAVDALQVLPDSCLVYLRTESIHNLENSVNERNLITDKLRVFSGVSEVFTCLHLADSIIGSKELLKEEFSGSSFHLALYPNANWILAASIKELGKQAECLELLQTTVKGRLEGNVFKFSFNGYACIAMFQDGGLLVSNNLTLLKLCEGNGAKLANNAGFKKFYSTLTENKLLSIYCNQTLLQTQKTPGAVALDLVVRNGYFSGGIDVEPSELRMNGYQWVDSSSHISTLLDQTPCETVDLLSSLPFDTQWFIAYGITNLFELPVTTNSVCTAYWNRVHVRALYNVKLQWKEHSGRVLARCGTYGQKQIVVCGSNDTVQTDEALHMMSDSTWNSEYGTIYRLSKTESLKLFEPYMSAGVNYAARAGENIYYCSDLLELQSTVGACNKGRYLVLNEDFLRYMQSNVPDKFHYLLYNAPSQAEHLALDFVRLKQKDEQDVIEGLKPTNKVFENFRHLSYSLLAEKNYFKCRFHLKHETAGKEKEVLWTTVLDTTCSSQVYSFINHNTNEHELLVQDDKNQLYLLNAKGSILWKKTLDEKITSAIHRVDCYKNGKFQLLFSTSGKIYLLDRNGENLPNFPVRLPAPATAELSVFDYENTRDYRVLIPCANKQIYNYTLGGKKSDGFSKVITDDLVQLPVQYVTVGPSQYLVAIDVEGKIYSFSRKGVGRIGLRNRTATNCNNFYVDASNSPAATYLMYLDESAGNLNKISFSDSKTIVKLNNELNHARTKFMLIDENRSLDVLVSSNEFVGAYDLSGNLLFEKTLPAKIDNSNYLAGDSYSLLLAYSAEAQKLFCFDLLHNKEIKVNATAIALVDDLFKDNKQCLIVPNGNEISCVPLR